jgi:hypothetical protein
MLPQQFPPANIWCAPLGYLALTRELLTDYMLLEMARCKVPPCQGWRMHASFESAAVKNEEEE